MILRVGKVTNIYPALGKVKVLYEDVKNTSLPLPMLTMNNEYSMPAVGDRVLTVHMANGSSKGFVLGTYYGSGTTPNADSGYRKDFGNGAYVTCQNGSYLLNAADITIHAEKSITFACAAGQLTLEELLTLKEQIDKIAERLDDVEEQLDSLTSSE